MKPANRKRNQRRRATQRRAARADRIERLMTEIPGSMAFARAIRMAGRTNPGLAADLIMNRVSTQARHDAELTARRELALERIERERRERHGHDGNGTV